jgi:hypothetical protein
MKRIGIALALMTVLLLPLLAKAGDNNPWERKLPFENATIKYMLSGSENGTEMLYIRKSGKEMATYHTAINVMGLKSNTVTIMTLDWLYNFDLEKKTGKKSANPHKYMIEEYNKLSKAEKEQVKKNARNMGTSMTKGLNGKIEMNAAKILGFDCDKATVLGTTVYSIHKTGIPLKSDTSMMGFSMKKEAMEVKQGPIDNKVFTFPEGIVPQEDPQADAMARSVAKQTIEMLKEPEGSQKGQSANPMMQPGASEGGGQGNAPSGMSNEKLEQAMKILKGMQNK